MPTKSRSPFKTITFQNFEILIGRSDVENDQLTFEVAESDDIWLHVGGDFPGSHVVIRKPAEINKIPTEVLRRAADLAALLNRRADARRSVAQALGHPSRLQVSAVLAG
jgi:predicted ribosome quality control (RQC) complex YloA/Tae2 family protein